MRARGWRQGHRERDGEKEGGSREQIGEGGVKDKDGRGGWERKGDGGKGIDNLY